ncbi:sialate O-acetylesterase [Xylanibacter muris]|uniref:Sialate O-acetylesterase n=1 Tax=Xylanibacter muris TaxID=2736290 RepID=A0ABX2AN57_9BACT|nr:sialate O-acetylesterase [Xylanibacter muris]NPD91462.1 sialate O-acetylesterase [Xylanibacter muris]
MRDFKNFIAVFLLSATGMTYSYGQLRTPKIISSDMVLQQNMNVPIWGHATPGERITVTFNGQKICTKTAKDSTWSIKLKPMRADATPKTMRIKGKKENLTYTNIVVGEVWIASGQSNMEYSMRRHKAFVAPKKGKDLAIEEMAKPANNMIRVYVSSAKKQRTWAEASGESLPNVSAVGYYFIKSLQDSLKVPVGIITAALGGTRIETWTPEEEYFNSPDFSEEIKKKGRIDGSGAGERYRIFISPLIPFAVRGCLWYQGENNCGIGDERYAAKYKLMVDRWRKDFMNSEMPFYSVLLAPHIYSNRLHRNGTPQTAESLPLFREEQKKATSIIPHTEYVSITDLVDDINDIHPSYKWTVGQRLADVALAKTYGHKNIEYSGPRAEKAVREGNKLIVSFSHTTGGLTTNDNMRLRWFEVAGKNGVYHPAVADIDSNSSVKVYSKFVPNPKYVRMGWHETAEPNLTNGKGLPVVPFATIAAE